MKNYLSSIAKIFKSIDTLFAYLKCWYFHTDYFEKENIKSGKYHKCNTCGSEYLQNDLCKINNASKNI